MAGAAAPNAADATDTAPPAALSCTHRNFLALVFSFHHVTAVVVVVLDLVVVCRCCSHCCAAATAVAVAKLA